MVLRLASRVKGLTAATAPEGYLLDVAGGQVTARARTAHGLFNAVQTIRQLLPAVIDASSVQHVDWTMPAVHVLDYPRFGYRGFMLDIARHFQPELVVEKLLDRAAEYKINTFHLHLSDDQGFRVVINGFPRLTSIGSIGSVGTAGRTRDPGGYWTQAQYRRLVAYAAARFITVVPEVDTPGHTNAIVMSEYNDTSNPALSPTPHDINCTTNDPPQWNFTGDVGYSALCPESRNTWAILTAIISQLTAMSPGPYYHLGGDEVPTDVLTQDRYAALVNTESGIVTGLGKTVMGWAEIAGAGTNLPAGSVAEYWNPAAGSDPATATGTEAVAKHMRLVMAPANHTYLDMKYAPDVPKNLGQTWACETGCDVDQFYNWDPAAYVDGVTEPDVIGVEAAMWTETVRTLPQVETMVFPRLLATAELGWSPRVTRTADSPAYQDFLTRLGAQGPRLTASQTRFYASPEVPWQE
jgi:hexosaminidase